MTDLFKDWAGEIETNIGYLQSLAQQVDRVMRDELEKSRIHYDFAEARIYNIRCVGVQGDERSYTHPAEITLFKDGDFVWDTAFLEKLSSRITNDVYGINRVVYVLQRK